MKEDVMDKEKMIDDIVAMLDGGMSKGDGHINVKVNEVVEDAQDVKKEKSVIRGCAECSINATACSIPTSELPGDDEM